MESKGSLVDGKELLHKSASCLSNITFFSRTNTCTHTHAQTSVHKHKHTHTHTHTHTHIHTHTHTHTHTHVQSLEADPFTPCCSFLPLQYSFGTGYAENRGQLKVPYRENRHKNTTSVSTAQSLRIPCEHTLHQHRYNG